MNSGSPEHDANSGGRVEQLQAAVEELRLLNEIAVEATGAISVDALLNVIVDKSLRAMKAQQASILLCTDKGDEALKTYLRQDNQSTLRPSYRVGAHVTGYVLHHRTALLVGDLQTDPRFAGYAADFAEIRSVLCVPIINRDELLGVMLMINKKEGKPFTEGDRRLLTIVSTQAGQLIVNARLQAETARRREELTAARLETEKWRELDELKSRFFADISHELRAPLTLILGPLEELLSGKGESNPEDGYRLMWRNGRRLLRLITQMLDIARLEAGSLKLTVSEGDIISCIESVVSSFRWVADRKSLTLRFAPPHDAPAVWFDAEKVETILYNLLSNALKFTPEHGTVDVEASFSKDGDKGVSTFRLRVTDSGRGIPPEDLKRLFDRYYQVKQEDRLTGSGIGLALTKGLVELHHGHIEVSSEPGRGSIFVVELPVDKGSFAADEITGIQSRLAAESDEHTGFRERTPEVQDAGTRAPGKEAEDSGLPLMLIAEDEADMRQYLRDRFRGSFRVYEATEGGIALSIAGDVIPDIVIADVSMPGVDGIELCRQLKRDERTSHVPVVMLTAQAAQASRISGLEAGADDYLTKPFDWAELETRVHNLIEGRRRLRERFKQGTPFSVPDAAVTSMDQIFLKKVVDTIEREMGDEAFGVEDLARSTGMSYSQLHRKLTALVDRSPNQLIRSIRLRRARDLIERNAATISEIAYTVGFASPAYFTKCFHEEYGVVPSGAKRKGTEK